MSLSMLASIAHALEIAVALATICFVPGYALQRRLIPAAGERDADPSTGASQPARRRRGALLAGGWVQPAGPGFLERCFLGVSTSLALASLSALVLAQVGWFSIELLAASLLAATALIWASTPRPAPRFGDTPDGPDRSDRGAGDVRANRTGARRAAILLAILVLWSAAAFLPPSRTALWGDDSTLYVGFGAEISNTGSYLVDDELVQSMSLAARRELFRNRMPQDSTGEYARFPGGISIPDIEEGRVAAGFSPLFAVWIAILHQLFGLGAVFYVCTFFGVLGVVAVFFVGRSMDGDEAGFLAALLLASCLPQIWFSRYPMTEVVAQFFAFAAIWALMWFLETRLPLFAASGGLLVGVALLVRVDMLPIVGVSTAAFVAYTIQARPIGGGRDVVPFVALSGALAFYCLAHLALFPSNYGTFLQKRLERLPMGATLRSSLEPTGPAMLEWAGRVLAALAIVAFAYGVVKLLRATERADAAGDIPDARQRRDGARLEPGRRARWLAWSLAASVTAYAAVYFTVSRFRVDETVSWLAAYLSWPLLGLFAVSVTGVALVKVIGEAEPKTALLLVVLVAASMHYLYNPQELGVHIWTMRRFVPVILPGIFLVVSLGVVMATRRAFAAPAGWLELGRRWFAGGATQGRATTGSAGRGEQRLAPAGRQAAPGERRVAAGEQRVAPGAQRTALAAALALMLFLVGRPSLGVVAQPYWGEAIQEADELAGLFAEDAVVLVGPELAGTHVQATLTYLYGRDGIVLQDRYPAPSILEGQIVDWLRRDRAVYLLVAAKDVHFHAPDLVATERGSDEIDVTVLESTATPPPRRTTKRSVRVVAYRLGIRDPERPKDGIDVGTYADDALFVLRGFHAPESDPSGRAGSFRWTTGEASIEIPGSSRIAFLIAGARPDGARPARLWVSIDGLPLIEGEIVPNEPTVIVVDDPRGRIPDPVTVRLRSTTFNPRQQGLSDDGRDLGVRLYRVEFFDGVEPAATAPVRPPPDAVSMMIDASRPGFPGRRHTPPDRGLPAALDLEPRAAGGGRPVVHRPDSG